MLMFLILFNTDINTTRKTTIKMQENEKLKKKYKPKK